MATPLLPTPTTCLITWRARWGAWTWRVLFYRYVLPVISSILGLSFLHIIFIFLWQRSAYCLYLPLDLIFPPSGSTTSAKPHAADPTSSPAHAYCCPIFPRSSQHDLCPWWCPHRASHHHSSANKRAEAEQEPTTCSQDPPTQLQREQPQWVWPPWWTGCGGQAIPVAH